MHIKTQDQLNLTTQVLFDYFSLLSLDVSTGSKFGHSTQGLPRLSLDKVDRPNLQKQQIRGNKIKKNSVWMNYTQTNCLFTKHDQ